MEIHLIWAQNNEGGIGKKGRLPWHIAEDLKKFKKLTSKSIIIMGRKTWLSLPIRPLPKRRNIILSRSGNCNHETYKSVDLCLHKLKNELVDKIFIIGGRSIYKAFYEYAEYLHITFVDYLDDDIDVFFPIEKKEIKKSFELHKSKILSEVATYTLWKKKLNKNN